MPERLTYLVLELGWALPPLALQWLVGWRWLLRNRRAWLLGVVIPTVYLALADSTALGLVWTIDPAKSLGLAVGNVPLEEIVFFLLTNTLVVQTVILAAHSKELARRWRLRLASIKGGAGRRAGITAFERAARVAEPRGGAEPNRGAEPHGGAEPESH